MDGKEAYSAGAGIDVREPHAFSKLSQLRHLQGNGKRMYFCKGPYLPRKSFEILKGFASVIQNFRI
eukprot:364262-Chlamydomonas_euryale.AAC.25